LVSTYLLGWVVDKAILGGAAWLLGGIATFSGALLQRWQSGNLRSYAAWLAAGAAAVLLFLFAPAILGNFGYRDFLEGLVTDELDRSIHPHIDPPRSSCRSACSLL
jgi:hypothetical protein